MSMGAGATSPPVAVAVVGCGALARSQHLPNIARSARAILHTCCDVDDDALAACQQAFTPRRTTRDFHDAVADPEVGLVVLATTEKLRLPVIEACAAAGKPLYVEKPVAGTLEELRRVERVVADAGIPVCVGHNRRCAPAMVDARAWFRRHMQGDAACPWRWDREGPDRRPDLPDADAPAMAVRINDDWYSWKAWVFDDSHARFGPMLFEMTHFTDLCNWFLDAEPVEVVALSAGMLNHGVIVRYADGATATITMGANGTFGYPKELYEVWGRGGLIAVDHMLEVRSAGIADAPDRRTYPMLGDRHPGVGTEGGLPGWLAKKRAACAEAAAAGDPLRIFTAEPDKGHAHALERFLDEIEGRGPVVCGIADAARATRVAFAAIRAADEGRAVAVADI